MWYTTEHVSIPADYTGDTNISSQGTVLRNTEYIKNGVV
jgi:hypothetical protein